jgi:hypothetical protein
MEWIEKSSKKISPLRPGFYSLDCARRLLVTMKPRFAGGIFVLAVVADKKIKIELRQGTLYPNFYEFLAGKSSLARKSTAADKTAPMRRKMSSIE